MATGAREEGMDGCWEIVWPEAERARTERAAAAWIAQVRHMAMPVALKADMRRHGHIPMMIVYGLG